MSCQYCHSCERNVDLDFEEFFDEDICMKCHLEDHQYNGVELK